MATADPVRREYDRLASAYDERWKAYIDASLELVLSELKLDGRERLLDVPCGTGELERRLLARWPELRIVGADLSPEMLKRAKPKNGDSNVEWIEADVKQLPLPSQEFDCVVCASSFHYFRSPVESLREMHRVLRPGGTLVLVDWCDDFLACRLCGLWLRLTGAAFDRIYSARECGSLLEEAGFIVERTDLTRVGWVWGLMRLVCRRQVK